jgi:hypothetical protein
MPLAGTAAWLRPIRILVAAEDRNSELPSPVLIELSRSRGPGLIEFPPAIFAPAAALAPFVVMHNRRSGWFERVSLRRASSTPFFARWV